MEKAWIADLAPADARGTAFGILQRGARPWRLLASSLIFGVIWTRVSPQAAFLTGAALALAATLLLYLLFSRSMKKILVTNDDGVHSEGIHALARGARSDSARSSSSRRTSKRAPSATR